MVRVVVDDADAVALAHDSKRRAAPVKRAMAANAWCNCTPSASSARAAAHALRALWSPGTRSSTRSGPREGRNATPCAPGSVASTRSPSPGPAPKRAMAHGASISTPSPSTSRPSAGRPATHSASRARTSSTES